MSSANLPLAFACLVVGGILADRAVASVGAATAGSASSGAPAPGAIGIPSVDTGAKQGAVSMGDLAKIGRAYGWTGDQIAAWWHVISAESGGNPAATNPSSGAFGIGQFLGATKSEYAPYGATSTDPMAQLQAMAKYIHDRYHTPAAAWAHEQSAHWY